MLSRAAREFTARTGEAVYLVGGSVRDALLKKPVVDFDVALAAREEDFARELARRGFGTPFRLSKDDRKLSLWRVAGRGISVDVARFPGKRGILGDLDRRDFTVNAMARDLAQRRIIDPFGGRRDLEAGIIRAVSEKNLRDDPLRVLRAYRLAATHGWTIARSTRRHLKRAAPLLSRVAPERISQEISRLFSCPTPSRSLGMAGRDGVLASAFGIQDNWKRACSAAQLSPLDRWRGQSADERVAGRLAALFFRLGAPVPEVLNSLQRLRFGKLLIRSVLSRRTILDDVLRVGNDEVAILFEHRKDWPSLRIFLRRAVHGPFEKRRLRRVVEASRKCRFSEAPVDGNDISRWLGIPPGPGVGQALEEARRRHFSREWSGRRQIREGLLSEMAAIDRSSRLE
jgi:tRNA nucleotidyltransferase/poly(A) polymerase